MSNYVSAVELEINGQVIDDFKKVREGKVELHKPVNLMKKTGFLKTTPRHTVGLDYVIPSDTTEFDFSQVIDGTLTIDRGNGSRTTYTGVTIMEIGETEYDGDNEAIRPIQFGATAKMVV